MDNKNETLYGLGSDMQLLQFLRSKSTERFSKVDAFCDLMSRMTAYPKSFTDSNNESISQLGYGRFTGSISELAHDWHWHRATVRAFLDGLEKQGYLKRQLDGRNYIFQLRTHANVSVPVSCNETIRDLGFFLLRHHQEYEISALVLAKYFEEYYKLIVDKADPMASVQSLAEHKAETIMKAFGHLELSRFKNLPEDEPVLRMIASTFMGVSQWAWTKWIKALLFLDEVLSATDFPSVNDSSLSGKILQTEFTEIDIRLLRELFYHLKKFCESKPVRQKATKAEDSSSSLPS